MFFGYVGYQKRILIYFTVLLLVLSAIGVMEKAWSEVSSFVVSLVSLWIFFALTAPTKKISIPKKYTAKDLKEIRYYLHKLNIYFQPTECFTIVSGTNREILEMKRWLNRTSSLVDNLRTGITYPSLQAELKTLSTLVKQLNNVPVSKSRIKVMGSNHWKILDKSLKVLTKRLLYLKTLLCPDGYIYSNVGDVKHIWEIKD